MLVSSNFTYSELTFGFIVLGRCQVAVTFEVKTVIMIRLRTHFLLLILIEYCRTVNYEIDFFIYFVLHLKIRFENIGIIEWLSIVLLHIHIFLMVVQVAN